MFKKLFLFSLLIIATFSETIGEANKEDENGEGEKGSGEGSGKEKAESENKYENGSEGSSSDDKEHQQLANLTKGINVMDKEFNIFLSNYMGYLVDSDLRIAKKNGTTINKTEGNDDESDKKPINIEELKKQAKEIRMDMSQFMKNLKEGEDEKKGDKKMETENIGDEGILWDEGDDGDKKELKGNGSDKGDEGSGEVEGDEGDKKEENGYGGDKGGNYSDYENECMYECDGWPKKHCKSKNHQGHWGSCIAKYDSSGVQYPNYPSCGKLPASCKPCWQECESKNA